jgi:hypothetical protein
MTYKRLTYEEWFEMYGDDAFYIANKIIDEISASLQNNKNVVVETDEDALRESILIHLYNTSDNHRRIYYH